MEHLRYTVEQAARDIVADGTQDEPFYITDPRELAARHTRWRELMPRVQPFYAVKCNDDRMLLGALATRGTGFDCASRGEIQRIIRMGVAPKRIIYANTLKRVSHLSYAASVGVTTVTFDSEAEVYKIKQHMPHAQAVLRIRCDASKALLYFGDRFGCDAALEAPALLRLAAAIDLEVVGVSFHVGSGAQEPEAYVRGIRHCRMLFTLGAALGHARMRLVDIGGGFPGHSGSSIEEASVVINAALESHFPDPSVRVIAEPGRYFATAVFHLAVMVHSKREVRTGEGETHTMYTINDGVFGSFNAVMTSNERVEPILVHPNDGVPQSCSIWGQTCSPLDCVVPSARLPPLQVGSWLMFKDMGAYTLTTTTRFNGFAPARVKFFLDRRFADYSAKRVAVREELPREPKVFKT